MGTLLGLICSNVIPCANPDELVDGVELKAAGAGVELDTVEAGVALVTA
jgi:hypothetical protein